MSNINGSLVCKDDGTGIVTAQISGTGVKVHARVSLNGQDEREIAGPTNWSGTLSGTFANGETVYLQVVRSDGTKQIKVLTVDCPPPTTTTAPPTTTATTPAPTTPPVSEPPASVTGSLVTVVPGPTLPKVGQADYVAPAVVSGGIILVAGIVIASVFGRLQRRREQAVQQ